MRTTVRSETVSPRGAEGTADTKPPKKLTKKTATN